MSVKEFKRMQRIRRFFVALIILELGMIIISLKRSVLNGELRFLRMSNYSDIEISPRSNDPDNPTERELMLKSVERKAQFMEYYSGD